MRVLHSRAIPWRRRWPPRSSSSGSCPTRELTPAAFLRAPLPACSRHRARPRGPRGRAARRRCSRPITIRCAPGRGRRRGARRRASAAKWPARPTIARTRGAPRSPTTITAFSRPHAASAPRQPPRPAPTFPADRPDTPPRANPRLPKTRLQNAFETARANPSSRRPPSTREPTKLTKQPHAPHPRTPITQPRSALRELSAPVRRRPGGAHLARRSRREARR